MLLVKTILKFSAIHGVGCFTEVDIKKGETVWKHDPRFDLEFSEDEVKNCAPAVLDFLRMYSYGQENAGKKTLILCGDHARHMNHTKTPNLLEEAHDPGINIAGRDIKAGEELTCDYTIFDLNFNQKIP